MEYRFLGDITTNLDYKRRPLNSIDRYKISLEGLYPYIGANNILTYIDEYIFNEKILCVAEDGGSWGKNEVCSNIYDGKTWVNNHAHVLIENGEASLEFLRYYLNFADLNFHIKGSTRGKLTRSELNNIQIPLPSYENQIRIANLLEKIETTIAERKNGIDLLDELVKATFYQMFNQERKIKDISLKDLAKDEQHALSSGPFGSNLTSDDYVANGVLVLRGKNITDGRLNLSDSKFISLKKAKELKRSKIKPDDVVIVAVGSSGNALRIPNEIPDAIMSQNFNKITPNKDLVNPFFLADMINSEFIQKQFRDVTTNAGRTFLGLSKVRNITIPYYDLDLQNKFADIAQKIEIIKTEQEAQLKDLEELYASISHKVFEGDIDLSKVPFDASLLPNPIEVIKEEPKDKPVVIIEQKDVSKVEVEKVKSKKNDKGLEFGFEALRHLESWEHYSFKEIADSIIKHFSGHYFNAEMILNFLDKELDIQVNYYSSAEQKKNPQYENADDFYRFIATALDSENHFLQLEQVFYNAETENITDISFTEKDLESLSKKNKKERSGIYFHIKDEASTP
ncbi:type I restriction enzyme S subunit [Pedobacter psychrotolerans]|uniref:Type I restriction enzyme S subunit n=1 Tax=Pedobacter psychrotolerans TaxID=1843235 RepID=A0A4R2HLD3_9SPHI|nr:restriction endonuclease subunit S [Pedobacter psychrotolerans]TCO30937.1 type I restriction enzyme S subunit [Pedobacter psychrotolerans]GGE43438.1 hypothetical protein GCM10011413_06740 [Pedobacter psychrotolerans]